MTDPLEPAIALGTPSALAREEVEPGIPLRPVLTTPGGAAVIGRPKSAFAAALIELTYASARQKMASSFLQLFPG